MRSYRTTNSGRPLSSGSKSKARTFDYIPNMNLFKHDSKYNQTKLLQFENKYEDADYDMLDPNTVNLKATMIFLYSLLSLFFIIMMKPTSCEEIYKLYYPKFSLDELDKLIPEYEKPYCGVNLLTRIGYASILWLTIPVISSLKFDLHKILFRLNLTLASLLLIYNFNYSECHWLKEKIVSIMTDSESSTPAKDYFNSLNFNIDIEVGKILSIRDIYFHLLFSTILNAVLRIKLNISIGLIGLELLGFHLTSAVASNSTFILSRLFFNIFTVSFIKIIVSYLLLSVTQYYLIKASSEIWALYRGFKVSYNYIKIKFEDLSTPIFIISKKTGGAIFYKNKQATLFMAKISSREETQAVGRAASKQKENLLNFKALFKSYPTEYEEFIMNLSKDELGIFEYCFSSSRADSAPIHTFVSNFSITHKGQEAYLIQIIIDSSIVLKNQLRSFLTHLTKEVEMVIEELNIPLDQASDFEKELLDNIKAKGNNRSQFVYNSPPVSKQNAWVLQKENSTQQPQSDPKVKVKKFNVKSIVHQLLSLFSSSSVGQVINSDISECTSIKPKSVYSLSFYLYNLIQMLHYGTLSFEYYERCLTNNYCLSKVTDKRTEFDVTTKEAHSIKRCLSLRGLETPTGSSRGYSFTVSSSTQVSAKEAKRNPSTSGLIIIEPKVNTTGLDTVKMLSSPVYHAHVPQLNSVLDKYMKYELSSAATRPFFEQITNKLYLLTSKLGFSLSLNVQVNEGVLINKEKTELILFNVLYYILENTNPRINASEKKISDHFHKDKCIQIKIQKEIKTADSSQYNHLQVTIKFKDRYQKTSFTELRKLFGLLQKPIVGGDELCLSFTDKTRFFDFGILTAIDLISANTIGDNLFSVTCNDSGHSSTSLGMGHQSDDVEIRFSVPCVVLQTKDFFEKDDISKYEHYFNKVLIKIYKVPIARKQSTHECLNFEAENKIIFDILPDNYDDEEENLSPDQDRKDVFEPLRNLLNKKYSNLSDIENFKAPFNLTCTKSEKIKLTLKMQGLSSNLKFVRTVARIDSVSRGDFTFSMQMHPLSSDRSCGQNNKKHMKWDLKDLKIRYFTPPRYLIVEDSFLNRAGLGSIIKSYNSKHFIDLVDNGPEAFEKFCKLISQGYIYDYIFMDIEIPHIDGIKVAQLIREKEIIFAVHTNIAAVTGRDISEIPKGIFDNIFSKPFDKAYMLQVDMHFKKNRSDLRLMSPFK